MQWATEESIEVTAGSGTPAVATASTNAADITIETVKESTTFAGTTTLAAAAAAGAATITVANNATYNTTNFPASGQLIVGNRLVTYTAKAATQFTGCTGRSRSSRRDVRERHAAKAPTRPTTPSTPDATTTSMPSTRPTCTSGSIARRRCEASKVAGLYNQARESAHILLGVGDRNADLNAAYTAAGGGSAGATAANALFRFYNRTEDGLSGGYDVPVAFDNSGDAASAQRDRLLQLSRCPRRKRP